MVHTLDTHIATVNKLCRICAQIHLTKKDAKRCKKPRLCEDLNGDILMIFGLDVKIDENDKHSKYICTKCVTMIRTIKRRQSATSIKTAKDKYESTKDVWSSFRENEELENCPVCVHTSKLISGCIPFKALTKQPDQTTDNSIADTTCAHQSQDSITTTSADENASAHIPPNDTLSIHSISTNAETDQSTDQSSSVHQHVLSSPVATSTPIKKLKTETIDTSTSPIFKHDLTFRDSLSKSSDQALTRAEEQLNTHFIRRKLNTTKSQQKFIRCKTKGQPLILQKIIAPRKHTSLVRTPTKRKRTKILQNTRFFVAGTSEQSQDSQLTSELKKVPSTRRQIICKKAGIKQKVKISREQTLAMKEALGLSWRKGRKQGQLLKEMGIQLENEISVRRFSREIIKGFVKVENRLFVNEEGEFEAPFGRILDLVKFVDYMLDSYGDRQKLTWHGDFIPPNEIWLKIGGDHGKNSLKFTLQIGNTEKPNSKQNTIVIALAHVRDTHENMVRFLDGGFGDDIASLQTHTWREKAIKIFINGDYEFLCKIYGLSGPQGTYPCLWCLMPKRTLKSVKIHSQQRSLAMLHADNTTFMKKEHGDKDNVAKYHNSLHSPLLQIELDHVSPPYLHILLGIVLKHHRLLEEAAHDIDLKIASQDNDRLTFLGQTFKEFGRCWNEMVVLEEKLDFDKTCLLFSETDEDIRKYRDQVESTEHRISLITHQEITPRSGPVASTLDPILKKHRITPQAYHSRSFVGNHCHKYLDPTVYMELTRSVVTKTESLTYNTNIIDDAHSVEEIFDKLNQSFSEVHNLISHSQPITNDTLRTIRAKIDDYMAIYRQNFPHKTIPKQHILEHHCIPFITQHKFGLGLMGEQGTESSHQAISELERRGRGIANDLSRLQFILNSHLLQVSPTLHNMSDGKKKK